MRVTIAEVARRAGVGKATVSRVLNGKGDVDPSTAERVRQVIDEIGYVPSARAVNLARGRTRIVGMLLPSMTWPWMGEVMQGVIDVLEESAYGLLLYTLNRGEDSLSQFAVQVSSAAFDGLLAIEPPGTLRYLKKLYSAGLPVVLIDDRGHHPDFPSVGTTNREGGYSAAEHLLAHGRSRLAMISGPDDFPCANDRQTGFQACLTERGVAFDPRLLVSGDFTEATGFEAVARFLATGLPFDGIFAHSDLMAIGVLRALRKAGRTVPDDVAVVGFDDIRHAAYTEIPLTTVRQPMREMGMAAARLLLARLDGSPSDERVVLPTSLVVRDSTTTATALSASDLDIAEISGS